MANIGIDLGTTHSLVAVVLDGSARCLLDDEGRALVPSAVRFDDAGVPISVGHPALAAAGTDGGRTYTSVKRFMGRSAAEVVEEASLFGHELVPDEAGMVRFRQGGRELTPVEISSFVLRLLHGRAEECLFGRPGGAVITVPAYFDDAQRQATRDAARVAGIEVLRLLNEPTAAALAYGLNKAMNGQKIAVYDLGGGTFDISILELDDGVFQVLSTAGDTRLGGDDFDHALAGLLLGQVGIEDADGRTYRAAVRAAEAAKRALTGAESTVIQAELGGRQVEAELDRATFEALIRPIVAKTGAACAQALSDAGLGPADIDEVVLVGGSTRVPLVRAEVEALFGRVPHCELDPDLVVALGAAMQADILSGKSALSDDMLLLDVVPLSLGIEVMGGVTERLIPRCSTIPASATQVFTTHVDNQTAVDIHVLQGEREMVADNRSLAQFKLTGLPPMPAGTPRVRVQFMVDADGILRVSATEEMTATTATIDVQPTYGLSDAEIEDMLEEAIDHAEDDIEERFIIEARVEAEQILHHLEKAMVVDVALLEGAEAADFSAAITDLKAAMPGRAWRQIKELSKQVDDISAAFAQRRIERDLHLALSGKSTDTVAEQLGVVDPLGAQ
jgi:molecular chaperone HscA